MNKPSRAPSIPARETIHDRRLILWLEDSLGDQRLIHEALLKNQSQSHIQFVTSGEDVLEYLNRAAPNNVLPTLIVLDLNGPNIGGLSVLKTIKENTEFRRIPTIIFSSSQEQRDIEASYALQANSYISKPGTMEEFFEAIEVIEKYWFKVAEIPGR